MIILGIDPGTAITGFGIIRKEKNKKFSVIDYGCILTDSYRGSGERLETVYKEINKIIAKHRPNLIAIESVYFFKNLKTVMPVSQSKGVVLLAAAQKKIPVLEFTPLQVKTTITGYGRADKKQMQKMVKMLLGLEEKPKDKNKRKDDATDALGIAVCGGLYQECYLNK